MTNILIQRLGVMFGAPDHTEQPQQYIAELTRLLVAYQPNELNKAADMLIAEFRPTSKKPWPSPSQLCVACADARDILTPAPGPEVAHLDWSTKAIAMANKLIAGPMGQEAADNGWVLGLHDFCRKQARLPNDAEAYRIKVDASEFNAAFGIANASAHASVRALADGIGTKMLQRRDALSAIAWGGK